MPTNPQKGRSPERIELPGGFHLDKRSDGTYALFGAGSNWQVGCIGVEAITEFSAAMNSATLEAAPAWQGIESMRDRLKALVVKHRSQREAAKELGISPQYLYDIIKGRRDISAEVANKLGFERHMHFSPLPAAPQIAEENKKNSPRKG